VKELGECGRFERRPENNLPAWPGVSETRGNTILFRRAEERQGEKGQRSRLARNKSGCSNAIGSVSAIKSRMSVSAFGLEFCW
jgi:hypothetical protein